jgi:hypothetical protein
MKLSEGSKIIIHEQEAIIVQVIKYKNKYRYYLDYDIIAYGYTRDYIDSSEIQEVIEI